MVDHDGEVRVVDEPLEFQSVSLRRYLQGLLGDSPRKSMQAMLTRVTDPGTIKRSSISSRTPRGTGNPSGAASSNCCRPAKGCS
jgi:hypothetical protein